MQIKLVLLQNYYVYKHDTFHSVFQIQETLIILHVCSSDKLSSCLQHKMNSLIVERVYSRGEALVLHNFLFVLFRSHDDRRKYAKSGSLFRFRRACHSTRKQLRLIEEKRYYEFFSGSRKTKRFLASSNNCWPLLVLSFLCNDGS